MTKKLFSEPYYARSLVEASNDPLFTINADGKITDVNEATVKVTGFSRKKLIGTDFFEYFTDIERARKGYKLIFKDGFIVDYALIIRDHKLTDVLCNGSIYKDDNGNVLGVAIVARDVTHQKKIEAELIKAKETAELATSVVMLEKENAENAKLIAENAVKAKQSFLSNMSHEIRTPMNAIIGFTKVLLKTELTLEQMEYLQAIKISGDALILLINDILDLAKVDSGKMTFEEVPFKMEISISTMIHMFETKIREKNLELIKHYDKKIPEVLLGDPLRLHQIILNLLSNAIKFTSEGSIKVSVNLLDEDEEKVSIKFSVKDTGVGILKSKLQEIFESFSQATSDTARLYGGTGLGLSIVKKLIESQGGEINVSSEINKGSTFSFTLSFLKTTIPIEIDFETNETDKKIKYIKILVAEDILLNQLLMKTIINDFGFIPDIAANGKIAVEKLKEQTYDIVLMDLQMPVMNGFEATRYIRDILKSDIPIIALTADVTTADLEKCKLAGMNDYIAKPVNDKLLYKKIIGLVKKRVVLKANYANKKIKKPKYTDLDALNLRTKSDPTLMKEMILAYLEQTPTLINAIKQGLHEKDWNLLHDSVHKIIPSFSIMGISTDYENIAKKIQEFAYSKQYNDKVSEMVLQIESVCNQACDELRDELELIKTHSNE